MRRRNAERKRQNEKGRENFAFKIPWLFACGLRLLRPDFCSMSAAFCVLPTAFRFLLTALLARLTLAQGEA
jgi:hypothetical protein